MTLYFEKITEPILLLSYIILATVSFIISFLCIITAKYFFTHRFERDTKAVQNAHKGLVPRMGGLAIYLSIFVFILLLNSKFSLFQSFDLGTIYWLILSAFPVFLAGFLEDLGYNMSSKARIFSSAFSGLLVIFYFKAWISALGIPGLDALLSVATVAIAFTIFAATGVVNAFNLIDGLNGLTGYVAVSSAIALSIIAFQVNDTEMLRLLFILTASVMGFLILNYPSGKIFLGDSGAYILGHILVWCGILLVNFNSIVSPFSILLIFFWPVADTLLSIWRRLRLKRRADQPDRLHFHQLIMRFIEIRFFGRKRRNITNPVATAILVPMVSLPQVLGVFFWNDFLRSVGCSILLIILFFGTYIIVISLAKKT